MGFLKKLAKGVTNVVSKVSGIASKIIPVPGISTALGVVSKVSGAANAALSSSQPSAAQQAAFSSPGTTSQQAITIDTSNSQTKSMPWWGWVLIAVGVLATGGLLLVFTKKRR